MMATSPTKIVSSIWTSRMKDTAITRSNLLAQLSLHLCLWTCCTSSVTCPTVPLFWILVYFLLICILQMVPSISVTGGKPTTLIPLSFVLLTVLIKDAYEEFVRYRKDQEENQRKTQVLGPNGFTEKVWESIQSGQVIKIQEDEIIPCDALVLSSNLPDNKCFIETRSLDGETNLKVRKAPILKTQLHKLSPSELYSKKYTI